MALSAWLGYFFSKINVINIIISLRLHFSGLKEGTHKCFPPAHPMYCGISWFNIFSPTYLFSWLSSLLLYIFNIYLQCTQYCMYNWYWCIKLYVQRCLKMQTFILSLLSYLTLIHLLSPNRSRLVVNSTSITDKEEHSDSSKPGLHHADATGVASLPGLSDHRSPESLTTSSPPDSLATPPRAHPHLDAEREQHETSNESSASPRLDGRPDGGWSTALSLKFIEQTSAAPRCVHIRTHTVRICL